MDDRRKWIEGGTHFRVNGNRKALHVDKAGCIDRQYLFLVKLRRFPLP